MILVADCSALIALASCNALGYLETLYGQVIVPQVVFEECTVDSKPYATELSAYLKGKSRSVNTHDFVLLDGQADVGETQAMLLYKQHHADLLLIDDKRGRQIAKLNHINTIGSMRVLLAAKEAKLIQKIGPLLSKIEQSPVYLSKSLIEAVLDLAGETPCD
jgi:uncharacterized protein